MSSEPNYDDYKHDFMGKVGNIEDFSAEVLCGMAKVFADTIHYLSHAHMITYGPEVGMGKAWDIISDAAHGLLRPAMPLANFLAPQGWDYTSQQYMAIPFDCHVEDLNKPALMRLIKTQWDQYLKAQNYLLDHWVQEMGESAWDKLSTLYQHIIDYQYPKLCKVLKIEPEYVVDYLKLACMSIDGTMGYAGTYTVHDRNHVILDMHTCEVMERYRTEGLYPPDRAWQNCLYEERISQPFFPTCKLSIDLPPGFQNLKKEEPYCVWHYTKDASTIASAR